MKKFLKDLERELKKLKVNPEEIKEILEDHKEMLEQAVEQGLSDEELEEKFGEPEKLAKELKGVSKTSKNKGNGSVEGYDLQESYDVSQGIKEVKVAIVSADIKYLPSEKNELEVYFKDVQDPEDYNITLVNGRFELKRNSARKFLSFKRKSGKILIKAPVILELDEFTFATVSGDGVLENVKAKEVVIKSTSGDYKVRDIKGENIKLTSVSGDFVIENLEAQDVHFNAVSGDFEAHSVVVGNELRLNTVSGDFEFESSEANYVDLNTVSGDLDGNEFYINRIDFKSVSGDVQIKNEDKDRVIEIGRKKTLSGSIKIK